MRAARIEEIRAIAAGPERADLEAVDLHKLASMQFKVRELILDPVLHSQDLMMIFAARGIGKTHFAMAMVFAIATATQFGPWKATQRRRVLYLDGELPGSVLQQRLSMHCPDAGPEPGYLRVYTPDMLPDDRVMPDLSTYEGQDEVEPMIQDADVVVIDNLSAWCRSGRENDSESWIQVADWLMQLRRRGIAVILVHHSGKAGDQRGTSKREDLLDAVIRLKRPVDYDPRQGAAFVAEFTKARHLTGESAESIEFLLDVDDDRARWTWRTVEASTYDRVVALHKDGLEPKDIAAELGVNKSTVSRHLKAAKEKGVQPGRGAR